MLAQIYRETKVTLANLLPNEVALQVIAGSLDGPYRSLVFRG